jgi:hypothetical protein
MCFSSTDYRKNIPEFRNKKMYKTVHNEHRKILDICTKNLLRIVVYERYTRFFTEWLVSYPLPKKEPWELI